MSVIQAPGVKGQIPVWSRCEPRRIFCAIVPLTDARRDASGCHLHLVYELSVGTDKWSIRNRALPNAQGPVQESLSVRFGGGSHRLNYAGSVYLTGGTGHYDVTVFEGHNIDRVEHWHWLEHVTQDVVFQIPPYHSAIAAGGTLTSGVINGGFDATLDHIPIPVMGGSVNFGVSGKSIVTGWWG